VKDQLTGCGPHRGQAGRDLADAVGEPPRIGDAALRGPERVIGHGLTMLTAPADMSGPLAVQHG
jgi:hypothetical protein